MKKIYLVALCCFSVFSWGQENRLDATLVELSQVSTAGEGGLYFAGTKNVNFGFSPRISPHGDCIDIVNGYAFVTWYKGGMDKRNLMLSRKNLNVPNSNWVTIEFPHQHVGIRGEILKGTGIRGDSHNTAAIGVSTIDNTIHIIYDMHAYSATLLPTEFFNYSVSLKEKAFVPDNEFTLDIFNPKRTFLRSGQNYERLTYPMLHRANDGSLVARYRVGGSGNGDILMAHYDGNQWSNNWTFQDGTLPAPTTNSLYGGERFINGKFYSGFSIRYSVNNSESTSNGFSINSGLYYAYTNGIPKSQATQWFDVKDRPITLPIRNNLDQSLDPVQIAQPSSEYGTATLPRTTSDPAWTVTESGAIHFITRVDGRNVHYYKLATDASFTSNVGGLIPNPDVRGEIYSYKNHVFMAEIISGKLNIKTTLEGKNDWKIIYRGSENINYNHFNAFVTNNKLYVYLMQNTGNNTPGVGDKRPLFFQEFTLSEVDASTPIVLGEGGDTGGGSGGSDDGEETDAENVIQFEGFNEGSNQNSAIRPGAVAPFGYSDASTGNVFTNTANLERFDLRPTTDVDIVRIINASDASTIGQILVNSGGNEFLYYTVEIPESGKYHIEVNYGHGNANPRAIRFERVDENFENPVVLVNGSLISILNSFTMGTNPITDATSGNTNGNILQFDIFPGTYIIKVTTINSGPNYNWFKFVRDGDATTLSTNNPESGANSLRVFPNPAKDGQFNLNIETNWDVYSVLGVKVLHGEGKNIDLSKLNKGIYVLKTPFASKMLVSR